MTFKELFSHTFKAIEEEMAKQPKTSQLYLPCMEMVNVCRADDFDFFEPFIAAGMLTSEQMHHAAQRYHLGKSKSGKPIYWMINEMMRPLDAHIGDEWIHSLLKKREPVLEFWMPQHCLFGLHLIYCHEALPISIVEREEAAVVLSELFPEHIWLAYVTFSELTPGLMAQLEGRTVIFHINADIHLDTYVFFDDYRRVIEDMYDINITIDDRLDDYATDDQKRRGIDLLDYLLESLN